MGTENNKKRVSPYTKFYKILNEITNPEGIPPLLVYNQELDCYELGEYNK